MSITDFIEETDFDNWPTLGVHEERVDLENITMIDPVVSFIAGGDWQDAVFIKVNLKTKRVIYSEIIDDYEAFVNDLTNE